MPTKSEPIEHFAICYLSTLPSERNQFLHWWPQKVSKTNTSGSVYKRVEIDLLLIFNNLYQVLVGRRASYSATSRILAYIAINFVYFQAIYM